MKKTPALFCVLAESWYDIPVEAAGFARAQGAVCSKADAGALRMYVNSAHFYLNGIPFGETENGRVSSVRSHRIWALVGFLALHRGAWVQRSEIAEALWPSLPQGKSRQSLRQTLLLCNQLFGKVIRVERNALMLDVYVCLCDVWESGPTANFLETLSDDWIEDARPKASPKALNSPPTPFDRSLGLLVRQSGVEFDQTLTGMFQVWMSLGIYDAPIAALQSRQATGTLSCRGYAILALLYSYKGNLAQAISVVSNCEHFGEADQDPYFLYAMGLTHYMNFRQDISREYLKMALNQVTLKDPFVLFSVATVFSLLCTPEVGMPISKKYAAMAEENGFPELACFLHLPIVKEWFRNGKVASVRKRLRTMKATLSVPGREGTTSQCLGRTGRVFESIGDRMEARECYLTALEQASKTDGLQNIAEIATYLADFSMEEGDLPSAMQNYNLSVSIRRDIDHRWGLATSLRGAGVASLQLGLMKQAESCLKEALSISESMSDERACASVLLPLAKLFAQRNQRAKAIRCASAAKEMISTYDEHTLAREIPAMFITHADVEAFLVSMAGD